MLVSELGKAYSIQMSTKTSLSLENKSRLPSQSGPLEVINEFRGILGHVGVTPPTVSFIKTSLWHGVYFYEGSNCYLRPCAIVLTYTNIYDYQTTKVSLLYAFVLKKIRSMFWL